MARRRVDSDLSDALELYAHYRSAAGTTKYTNTPLTLVADDDHARRFDVMRNAGRQDVYSYNIAMMLYAFKFNKLQTYGNTRFGMTSEVYFRSEGLFT